MKLADLFLEQLGREAEASRGLLAKVPEGKNDWKPHPKSMPMGQLAHMIALMPSWITMMVKQDELDVRPQGGGAPDGSRQFASTAELLEAHDKAVVGAREALSTATEERLATNWRLLEGGKPVSERPRYLFLMDHFGHTAHHRGQLTVYLRLNDVIVPAIYGPSADEHAFR